MFPFCSSPAVVGSDFVDPPINYEFVRVDRVQNGQRVSRVELKHDDGSFYQKFKARDFQLQEIIDAGAFDLLTPVSPLQVSKLASLDSVQRNSVALDDYMTRLSESVNSSEEKTPVSE